MFVIQRTPIPALAVSQFRTAVSLRLPPLRRGPVGYEKKACFGASALTNGQKTHSSVVSKVSIPSRFLFARGLTTSTGTPARSTSLSWPRGTRLQPNGNRSGWKLGPTTSTGGFHAFRSSALSTEAAREKDGLRGRGARVVLQLDTREVEVPLIWLRDHCRCSDCYNSSTSQKMVEKYSLGNDMAVKEAKLGGDMLNVIWEDGHCSQYSLKWLDQNFHCPASRVERNLWDAVTWTQQPLPRTSYEDHMYNEGGLRNTLSNIINYGFCLVEGAPETDEGTREVANRIGVLMRTMYHSDVETLDSAAWNFDDLAYTTLAVGPHTDTSYFSLPCGLQLFQIIYHDGDGGKTVLVDGFNQAEKVRTTNPSHFRNLATTKIPHEFIHPSRCNFKSVDTVLVTDERTDNLIRIRYNPYDRAPLSNVIPDDIPAFYDSYGTLANNINNEGSQLWMQLKPGTVLIFDNWRLLHGRSSFTGRRMLTTAYMSRDDWTNQARLLGLL